MQYLKSYLYTFVGGDSIIYKIHTLFKYIGIVAYAIIMIYFKWQEKPAYKKVIQKYQQCYTLYEYENYSCYEQAYLNYTHTIGAMAMTKLVQNLLNTVVTGFALWKLLQVAKRLHSTNTKLGINRGNVALHIFLLLLTVGSSATITYF